MSDLLRKRCRIGLHAWNPAMSRIDSKGVIYDMCDDCRVEVRRNSLWPAYFVREYTAVERVAVQRFPWWLGVSHMSYTRASVWLVLIPFNLLTRIALDAWCWCRTQHDSVWLYRKEREAYARGYDAGRDSMRNAYRVGLEDGIRLRGET